MTLRSPRWLVAHVLVALLAILFINLGLWQLRRLEERRVENVVAAARMAAPVEGLDQLLRAAGPDLETLRLRTTRVTGRFRPEAEVLLRSQVHLGMSGFHILTPLEYEAGKAVLVDRGWIPLEVPASAFPPPSGEVTVQGVLLLSQQRRFGPADPEAGVLTYLFRVDIPRLDRQMPWELAPVYIAYTGGSTQDLPAPVPLPDVTDEGPHLVYAVQWFAFTIIGLVGYGFLLRRSKRQAGTARSGTTSA